MIGGELEPIRVRGEVSIPIADFWPIFKQKVEYEADELLSFIIFSDNESFSIDPEINIADEFVSNHSELESLVFEHLTGGCFINTYPHIDIDIVKQPYRFPVAKDEKEDEELVNNEMATDSLQTFFRRKTRELQKESYQINKGK
ncbi:hypothetical protein BIT28_10945 [Photobacterium proteolyticum]|uniref:Uncharacterized protein n=1 Tax=Photobacterium proteolyticum TaxID=1903952 RepID=A0A1Q9G768_9GAMM|nr:hypothetical protein BIT28_10945 [Photobacterium proteolyticum]